MTVRERLEKLEIDILDPRAARAADSRGRMRPAAPCDLRTCFQRDIDRVVHSKSFRRLKHKTQVFLRPEGDHYRTRMTHTLEVARIARTIARGLRLNEDLTEAIAFAHDLGHTPFGHAGERALNAIVPGGFAHNVQSLRVVDILEQGGAGLNLCHEVRDGILCHTGCQMPETLEGRIIRIADQIAYINHDIDDAMRGGIIAPGDLPAQLVQSLGATHGARINTLTEDVVFTTAAMGEVAQSPAIGRDMAALREFMFERVYLSPVAKSEEGKAQDILCRLYDYFNANPDRLPADFLHIREREGIAAAVRDYIAGMTDQYAISMYSQIFIPQAWSVK